jgi:hypothetical protein
MVRRRKREDRAAALERLVREGNPARMESPVLVEAVQVDLAARAAQEEEQAARVAPAPAEEMVELEAHPEELEALEAHPEELEALEARPEELEALEARPEELEALEAHPEELEALEAHPEELVVVVVVVVEADDPFVISLSGTLCPHRHKVVLRDAKDLDRSPRDHSLRDVSLTMTRLEAGITTFLSRNDEPFFKSTRTLSMLKALKAAIIGSALCTAFVQAHGVDSTAGLRSSLHRTILPPTTASVLAHNGIIHCNHGNLATDPSLQRATGLVLVARAEHDDRCEDGAYRIELRHVGHVDPTAAEPAIFSREAFVACAVVSGTTIEVGMSGTTPGVLRFAMEGGSVRRVVLWRDGPQRSFPCES